MIVDDFYLKAGFLLGGEVDNIELKIKEVSNWGRNPRT